MTLNSRNKNINGIMLCIPCEIAIHYDSVVESEVSVCILIQNNTKHHEKVIT